MKTIFRGLNKRFWLALGFLALVAFLRLYRLNEIPPAVFGDEADVGYHAYSLWKTGKDYYGQLLPIYIRSLAEWRTPLLMYITAPFVGVFGLNEWGLRLPSAVFGILSIVIFYLLVKELFKDRLIAGLATLFLATSPWHIQYSRMAFELSFLLFLFLAAIYLTLVAYRKNWLLVLAAIFWGLTPYAYSTANVLMPLLLGLLVFVYRKRMLKIERKWLLVSIVVLGLLLIPIGREIIWGHAADRAKLFSVFGHQGHLGEIIFQREMGGFSFWERIFHNRPLSWLRLIGLNYLSAFSPLFLLERGDVTFRHSVQKMGQILWSQLPLLILGVYYLAAKAKKEQKYFWLGWLLIAPIPASLTWDGACHTSRLFLLLPPLMVIFSVGLLEGVKSIRSKLLRKGFLAFWSIWLLIGFIFYLHRYYVHYPIESWRWWHLGYKKAMNYIQKHDDEYELIVINNTYEPALLHFLFETGYDPIEFHRNFKGDVPRENALPGIDAFSLGDKYYFGTISQEVKESGGIPVVLSPKMLYLISQEKEVGGDWDWRKDPPSGVKVLETAVNPYNKPIFYLVTHE